MKDAKIKFKKKPASVINSKPSFITEQSAELSYDSKGLISLLKRTLRNYPRFYSFLFYIINPALFMGRSPKILYQLLPPQSLVVDIGSGSKRLRPNIVNVDIYPWPEVDVIADAHNLPFADGSVDGIIYSWVIEHLADPALVIKEAHRVLRPGGYIFLTTNFVFPYHSSPNDYYRWSREGLRRLLKEFKEVELAMAVGPTSALLAVFQEWLASALSFNLKFIKDILWILLVVVSFPLKLLDLILIRYRTGESIAGGFYFIGYKE